MSDRGPDAARYKAQGFWPIPCDPGTKRAAVSWTVYQRRQMTTTEMHSAWHRKSDANIALVLGPSAHLLVLNINMKHGNNGLRTINGYPLPTTPTILTPHDGLAYCFSVPDRERYPIGFRVHPSVPNLDGIELRGDGGYQLVPSSHVIATERDPAGSYRFEPGWTVERVMISLVPPPAWLLELWISLERDEPEISDHASQAFDTPTSASLAHLTATPKQPRRSRSRAAQRINNKQVLLKSGAPVDNTTVLSAENGRQYRGTFAYGCGLHLVRLLGQPGQWLEDKHTFSCLLPGHRESTPSARWVWQQDGSVLYHDLHVRTEKEKYWAVPEVYAAFITGTLAKFRDHSPSMKTWSIRLAVDAGLTEPYPIPKPVIPVDATPLVRTVAAGIWLVFACKWTYEVEKASMLGQAFLGGWCGGIPAGSVWLALRWLMSRRLLISFLDEERRTVYLPGKEWSL